MIERPRAVDKIVIIGAGECGSRAAVTLRELGISGNITLIGDESAAPYERPPLSKAALLDAAEPVPVTVCSPERFAELDIVFRPSTPVVRVDRADGNVFLADAGAVPYDRLLFTTGARARRLTVPGGDHAITLRTFGDAVQLREALQPGSRVVVIGAGFIGLEAAAGASARGCAVTVVEIAPLPMGRAVPAAIATVMADRHRRSGVEFRLGIGVDRIERVDDGYEVVLSDGDRLRADVVVAGVGAVPNVELAEASGLTLENGIKVNEFLATDDPAVYAAGDCCSFPHALFDGRRLRLEAWRNAQDQSVVAANNLLGAAQEYRAVPWFWSDQYELGLQIAGVPDAATHEAVRIRADGFEVRFGLDDGGRLVSASGVARGTAIAKDIRVAEMLIARRAKPDPVALADAAISLKSLLTIA